MAHDHTTPALDVYAGTDDEGRQWAEVCPAGEDAPLARFIGPEAESNARAFVANNPATVWIVEGECDTTPGLVTSAHRSEATATARAVELLDTLLTEAGMAADATPDNWRDRVEALEDETGGGSTVRLYALDLEP